MRNCCAGAAATPTMSRRRDAPLCAAVAACGGAHPRHRCNGGARRARRAGGLYRRRPGGRRDWRASALRARRQRPDGKPNHEPPYRALALERVRVVGDPVVAVVAETLAAAKEAAERVAVDYEPLPAVTDTAAAAAPGAPAVWDEAPDNVCFFQEVGDKAAVEAAFARASTSCANASSSPASRRARWRRARRSASMTSARSATPAPRACRRRSPADRARRGDVFKLPTHALPRDLARRRRRLRPEGQPLSGIRAGAVGGAPARPPGANGSASAAKRSCPTTTPATMSPTWRWRSTNDGRFLALRVAHPRQSRRLSVGQRAPCPPTISAASPATYTHAGDPCRRNRRVLQHQPDLRPIAAPAGRKPPTAIERIIDIAARELGIDRVELRRRNLIPPATMPFKTGLVFTYDCGEFEATMDKALDRGRLGRRAGAAASGARRRQALRGSAS